MPGNDRLLIFLLFLSSLFLPSLLFTSLSLSHIFFFSPFPFSHLLFFLHFFSFSSSYAFYCLLVFGYFLASSSGVHSAFIVAFVVAHPYAQVVPIIITTPSITAAGSKVPMIYVWVEEGYFT